jgi:hypothetical protein
MAPTIASKAKVQANPPYIRVETRRLDMEVARPVFDIKTLPANHDIAIPDGD